ncbi:MAG TPA: rod shape-determining protein MreD [Baekduia sp.]|uniref:rod shape-determining protein MreD n=1 Tax=Baekduia sp. TaxID=2600305 RepID=UPI002BB36615|nr:rod shape-determining protein MreD [Baekduia sp.]HMJ32497.1 rod shape-determining protein MreD [Baekduia sp.]
MLGISPQLVLRAALLGVAVVIVQVAAVSQIVLFGTSADLTPLVVAAVGLLCGSVAGATFGFAVGLFVDAALVQTMGLTSLVFIAAGYGAGRLRELRDPQAVVIPMIVGGLATAITTFGYGLMNFMLGIDAPVSFLLLRQILATIVLNALIALPVFALVRRWLSPVLPDDPRRRRRRAYTTGGLSPLSRS